MLEAAHRREKRSSSPTRDFRRWPFLHLRHFLPLLAEDTVAGFVLLRIDPADYLFPMIQSWPTSSPSAETLLAERQGDAVLFLNELRHRRGTALKLRLPVHAPASRRRGPSWARPGPSPVLTTAASPVRSVARPVEGTSWTIIAKVDREEMERRSSAAPRPYSWSPLFFILGAARSPCSCGSARTPASCLRQVEAESQKQALVQHFDYLTRYANDIILLSDET